MITVPQHNWETGQEDQVDYPDELFTPFLAWLFTTNRWREEQYLVEDKVNLIRVEMAKHRAGLAVEAAARAVEDQALADRAKAALDYVDELLAGGPGAGVE